jgi:ATP-binding cassette subfamily F protein 3
LALARLVLSGANLLLLDEPTNHLDIPSREAFELALSEYEGATIVVAHDRYFIDRFAERTLAIEDGRVVIGITAGSR